MKKFLVLLFATMFLAACSCGEVERFVPPEDEHIFVAAEDEYADEPFREAAEYTWPRELYMSPNANTPHTFLFGPATSFFSSEDAYKIDELLEGEVFTEIGFHFPYDLFHSEGSFNYSFNTGGNFLFNEGGEEIGLIRVWYEGEVTERFGERLYTSEVARLEILTVAEFEEREGFIESFEVAAYILGTDFRLPTMHMEMFGEPAFAPIPEGWLVRGGVIAMFEAEDRPEVMGGRSAALVIFIEILGDADVDYIIEQSMPHMDIERRVVAGTLIYRLYRDDWADHFMWAHNGLLYSFTAPLGVNVTRHEFYGIFDEREIFDLIASMIW